MNKKQIEMLRFIVKQEIEAAGIDGLYDHGAAAWTERMLDKNWKDFQETFTDPDELEYRSFDSIEELFEDLHADEKIYLRRLFQKEEKEKEKISEEENEGRLKACLEQIRKLTHADLVALMGEEWLEDYRRQFQ
jgi:hypothetical protein